MATTYLTRTPSSTGNLRTFTISFWVKKSLQSGGASQQIIGQTASQYFRLIFVNTDQFRFYDQSGMSKKTNRLFRDTNSWYHFVIRIDTTQSTASDRNRLYVNGVQETSFATDTNSGQNTELGFNRQYIHSIGRSSSSGGYDYFNGSLSHFHMCDGYSYAPTEFGETDSTTGEWKIKTSPSVSYGTNGFFILKDGNSVTDQSGEGNNWTVSGNLTNTEDNPSNVFNTLNPLCKGSYTTLSNANLTTTGNSSSDNGTVVANIPLAFSGKYYWEVKLTQWASGYPYIGLFLDWESVEQGDMNGGGSHFMGSDDVYVQGNSNTTIYSADGNITGQTGYADGDIVMFAADMDNGALYIGRNGTWQNSGDPTSGASKTGKIVNLDTTKQHMMAVHDFNGSDTDWNFGNGYFGTTAISSEGTNASGIGKFEYDVPTGYTALSLKGLNS